MRSRRGLREAAQYTNIFSGISFPESSFNCKNPNLKQPHPQTPMQSAPPLVGVVMGSRSDWPTLQHAATLLDELGVSHEARVVSAHRTPDTMREYALAAESRGLRAIIAGAGGAAHLPGMLAAWTHVPVLGVPVRSSHLAGMDSLLSIVQMPGGVPVATFSIGDSGAKHAALFAARMLAHDHPDVAAKLDERRDAEEERVLAERLP